MTLFNTIGLFLATHVPVAIVLTVLGLAAMYIALSYRSRPDRGNVIWLRPRRRTFHVRPKRGPEL